jgi:type II secretory pathway pseudopilin PulG
MRQRIGRRRGSGRGADAAGSGVAGFTITELLVVMIIITVVISILVPVLGKVRDSARAVTTQGQISDVVGAATQFSVDHKRQPGYFSARELGGLQNLSQGMSGWENVMLDLLGGVVGTGASASGQPVNTVVANPTNDPTRDAYVDVEQIGQGQKTYLVPSQKFLVQQHNDPGAEQQVAVPGHAAPEGTPSLPDLVDAWRNPILVWAEDESAMAPVNPVAAPPVLLAKESVATVNAAGARFYWASNAAFLKARALGRKGKNQTLVNANTPYSLLGGAGATGAATPNVLRSLESVLGNPNYAWKPSSSAGGAPTTEHPASARGPFIVHSAGSDGYYFGSTDRGASRFSGASQGVIDYTFTFWTTPTAGGAITERVTDKNGSPTNEDVISGFDDLLTSSAN